VANRNRRRQRQLSLFGAWWRLGVLASGALVIGVFYSGESALIVVAIPAIAALWIYAIDVLAHNQR
jgi:hypothetical protein